MAVKCSRTGLSNGFLERTQAGFGLILALMLLALLSLLAAAVLLATTTETRIGDNYRSEAQSLYLAEAGIEEGRELLRRGPLPATSYPFIQDREFVDATGRRSGRYSLTLLRTNPLMLKSVAVIGFATKTVEVRLRKSGFPSLPDAITLDEDIAWPPEIDSQISTTGGLERIVQGILRNATDVYEPAWDGLVELTSIGSVSDYRIVAVNGDCSFGNGTGYGVLLVRGELTLHDTFAWHGLILAIGQGVIRSSGVVSGSISGAVFLARTRESDRSSASPLGTLRSTRGPVTLQVPSDSVGIQRNETEINLANQPFPYVAVTYREY
jgi:hypothetical protein